MSRGLQFNEGLQISKTLSFITKIQDNTDQNTKPCLSGNMARADGLAQKQLAALENNLREVLTGRQGRKDGIINDLKAEGCTSVATLLRMSVEKQQDFGLTREEIDDFRQLFGQDPIDAAAVAEPESEIVQFLRNRDIASLAPTLEQAGFNTVAKLTNIAYEDIRQLGLTHPEMHALGEKLWAAVLALKPKNPVPRMLVAPAPQARGESLEGFLARHGYSYYLSTLTQSGFNSKQDLEGASQSTLKGIGITPADLPKLWNLILNRR